MLLKVLVYSYLKNVYSSLRMEEQIKEKLHMMWISGMNKLYHHTINKFRSERLKKSIGEEIQSGSAVSGSLSR
jgi:transposase